MAWKPNNHKSAWGNRIISFGRKEVNFQRAILILLPIVRAESAFTPEVTIKIRGMLEDIIFSKTPKRQHVSFYNSSTDNVLG